MSEVFRSTLYYHQSSCVNISAQNGVVDRKNTHETSHALLFKKKVPRQLWVDDVSTCFFINRMSLTILKSDNSYIVLCPNKPLFSIKPQIFGCTCYLREIRSSVTKLGYSRFQKGYHCYSPEYKSMSCFQSSHLSFRTLSLPFRLPFREMMSGYTIRLHICRCTHKSIILPLLVLKIYLFALTSPQNVPLHLRHMSSRFI